MYVIKLNPRQTAVVGKDVTWAQYILQYLRHSSRAGKVAPAALAVSLHGLSIRGMSSVRSSPTMYSQKLLIMFAARTGGNLSRCSALGRAMRIVFTASPGKC